MRLTSLKSWALATAVAAGALAAPLAHAQQKFPTKTIQLVIPFAPGDTDQMLRPVVDKMGEYMAHPVVMTYKPGAGGGVGAQFVAAAPPDGYTVVGSSPGSLVIVPLANKEFRYSTESFEPVMAVSEGVMLLATTSRSAIKSVDDLVKASKARPGSISYGTSGAMGITHLLAEIFAQSAGVKMNHIPFQGSAPAINALLGGHTDIASTAIGPAQAHLKAGALRPLAVFSDKRVAALPDVPTLKELGYNVGSPTFYGIVAPKGTPPAAIQAMYEAARKAVEQNRESINATYNLLGAEVKLLGPEEYGAYLQGQKALFSQAIGALKE